jgi:DNA-binding HxlR family transcriptional regulator
MAMPTSPSGGIGTTEDAPVRALERDGLVTRTAHPSIPPRVEYALTDLGRTLLDPVLALARWSIEHRDDVESARRGYDEPNA